MVVKNPRNQLPLPLESANQRAVLEHWILAGRRDSLVAAIPNAGARGQPGLTRGLADLLIIGDLPGGIPVGFIELKRHLRSPISQEQLDFAALCARHGVLCEVAYGRDEPIDILRSWGILR